MGVEPILREVPMSARRQIVSFGAGTNSVAVLVGLKEHGERPDAIVFADTGGEKPHTYELIPVVSRWCEDHGFPAIVCVKGSQPQQIKDGTLEAQCLRKGELPSKAYGGVSCSWNWKIDPFNRWVRAQSYGVKPIKLIGFDADEPWRAERAPREGPVCVNRYPLIEWGWGREECRAAIARAGLPQPGKSACFFCPSSKRPEILELRDHNPELLTRALEMERRALAGEGHVDAFRGKGLGRSFSWARIVWEADNQLELTLDAGAPEWDCGCYDG